MLGICCAALAQVTQQPTIILEPVNFTDRPGIYVHIVLKNTTAREFTVSKSPGGCCAEQYYSVSVLAPNGNPAAFTVYGANMEKNRGQRPVLSRMTKHAAPGEAVDEYAMVSNMFDMTAAGAYIVQVSRPSPSDGTVILKSNALTIRVGN